jgi:hypothetical protein
MSSPENPHRQLIETICHEVLPNMVRIYETQKMAGVVDYDYYVGLIELKVEQANRSLLKIDPVERQRYRDMIDAAYASSIDHLREVIAPQLRTVK